MTDNKETVMKQFLKEVAKMAIAVVLGLIYLWFLLSFKWSIEDMSTLEKCVGIVYGFVMVPVYYKLTDVMKLR